VWVMLHCWSMLHSGGVRGTEFDRMTLSSTVANSAQASLCDHQQVLAVPIHSRPLDKPAMSAVALLCE